MERLLQTGSIRAKSEATDFEAASDMSGVIHSLGTSAFGALLTFEWEKKPSHVTPDGFLQMSLEHAWNPLDLLLQRKICLVSSPSRMALRTTAE
jgi:hypothetical protein